MNANLHNAINALAADSKIKRQMAGAPLGFYLLGFQHCREAAAALAAAGQLEPAPGDFAIAAACMRNRARETRADGLHAEAANLERIANYLSAVAAPASQMTA